MDGLILTFTPEQLKKYKEIKCGTHTLPVFNARFDYTDRDGIDIASITEQMANEAKAILSYQNNNFFFARKMTDTEMDEFKDSYFLMINNIEALRKKLYSEISSISKDILLLDNERASLSRSYSEFLPYKAALSDDPEYKIEIERIDGEFASSFNIIQEYFSNKKQRLNILVLICDTVIPDFYRCITAHSGSPKFKKFNSGELFRDINAFTEKIHAIQKQKPM